MPKKESKRLIVEQLPPEHSAALSAVELVYRPTYRQYYAWHSWVDWKKPMDPEGWWYGWCPIADPDRSAAVSAQVSFYVGSARCLHDEPCHEGKRAISLGNLASKMQPADAPTG